MPRSSGLSQRPLRSPRAPRGARTPDASRNRRTRRRALGCGHGAGGRHPRRPGPQRAARRPHPALGAAKAWSGRSRLQGSRSRALRSARSTRSPERGREGSRVAGSEGPGPDVADPTLPQPPGPNPRASEGGGWGQQVASGAKGKSNLRLADAAAVGSDGSRTWPQTTKRGAGERSPESSPSGKGLPSGRPGRPERKH